MATLAATAARAREDSAAIAAVNRKRRRVAESSDGAGEPRPRMGQLTRYLSVKWALASGGEVGHDLWCGYHDNGVCVVGLAPCHAALQRGPIARVEYAPAVLQAIETSVGKPKGKNRYQMSRTDVLCEVVCKDGSRHPVLVTAAGSLLEINTALLDKSPDRLRSDAGRDGWLAILHRDPSIGAPGKLLEGGEYRRAKAAEAVAEAGEDGDLPGAAAH